jgi:CDP-diacylglycerol--glycerol-3-phosphate 3-phosphatidyltransferase
MASVNDLKPRLRAMLRPMVQRLAALGIRPEQLSSAALALAAVTGALIAVLPEILPGNSRALLILPVALSARVALTLMADMLTHEHAMQTPRTILFGEAWDALADALLYLPLALYPGVPGGLVVTLVVLGLCAEVVGLAGHAIGAGRRGEGPMGRNDRAIVFGLVALIMALDPDNAVWLPWLLLPASAMAVATIVNRIRASLLQTAKGQPSR